MKKILNISLILLTAVMINTTNVKAASDIYYTNKNGISFTKEEYEYFSKMYYEGIQETLTQQEYKKFEGQNMDPSKVVSVEKEDDGYNAGMIRPMNSNSYETPSKILKISKGEGEHPTIVITATWKKSPNVRSYDLIGAYLAGVSSMGSPSTMLRSTAGTVTPSATKYDNNGWGASIKLPSSGSDIIVAQTFSVTKGGRVYASYQHATSALTLNNSQSFSVSGSGLGHVFYFSNANIRNKYDAMSGVYINV